MELERVWERLCVAISRNRGFTARKLTIANPQISRVSALNGPPVTDRRATRPSRDGSEQFGSGTQAYTAKFEPAAWSWAQMTSGFGAPKRIFECVRKHNHTFKHLNGQV